MKNLARTNSRAGLNEDRDRAVVEDVVADTAEQRRADGAAATRAHDHQVVVAVLDLPEQRAGWAGVQTTSCSHTRRS